MFDLRLEKLVKHVRKNASAEVLPINPEKIAEYEGIILQAVREHAHFNGKIEFLADEDVFVIYHPDRATYRYPARLRFSLAHELAHFYIDEHREALVRGETHSSESGYRSKNPKEIQADEFASALLIPAETMEPQIAKRGFLTFEDICRVAKECRTSPYATAIRYVKMASEACLVTLAQDGKIKSSFPSDEARIRKFGKLSIQALPDASPGYKLAQAVGSDQIREQEHSAASWFGREEERHVWESCVALGEKYTLSFISIQIEDED